MRRGSTHGLRRDSARFRSGEGQSLRNPGQLHDRPSAGLTVRLLGSKIYEATIASLGSTRPRGNTHCHFDRRAAATGIIARARRYEGSRLEATCERPLAINAISYSSVSAIRKRLAATLWTQA